MDANCLFEEITCILECKRCMTKNKVHYKRDDDIPKCTGCSYELIKVHDDGGVGAFGIPRNEAD